MQGVINTPFGYAIWCQRGRCYRCKDKKCACAHHSGGEADNDIVRECIAHGARRGPLQPYCQMGRHSECKRSHCMCDCHALGGVRPTPEPEPAPQTISVEGMDQEELQEALEQAFDKRAEPLRAEFSAIKDEWLAQSASLDEDIEEAKRAVAEADKVVKETAALAKVLDKARRIEVKLPKQAQPIDVGTQHYVFGYLLELLGLKLNVFARGPAGSGKTAGFAAAARALGIPFYLVPIGPQTSKSDLLGYMSATGVYIATLLRKAYETGGLVLFDEIDRANAGILTIIHSLTSNGEAGFPDKMIKRHKNCYIAAAGNTYGRGADSLYVGAAQLDAATLDRWVMLDWEYDWDFAAALSGNTEWTGYIHQLHERASALKMRVVIGMRAVLHGSIMLAAGIERDKVEHACIWAPISRDDKDKILAGVM